MATRKWAGGAVRGRYYWIMRTHRVTRKEYRVSTGVVAARETLPAALAIYSRWEQDPDGVAAELRGMRAGAGLVEAAEAYLSYSRLHGRSGAGNSERYVADQREGLLSRIIPWLRKRGIEEVHRVDRAAIVAYAQDRKSGKVTGFQAGPHAVGLDVAYIKSMLTWAATDGGLISANPLRDYSVRRPKYSGKTSAITPAEWAKLRPFLASSAEGDLWQVCGDVLLATGMRWSSLHRMAVEEINVKEGSILLPAGKVKGKVEVHLRVPPSIAAAAARIALRTVPESSTTMNHILTAACLKAGMPHISCHSFRHGHAMAMLAVTNDLKAVQSQLGHADVTTTSIYVKHLTGSGQGTWTGPLTGDESRDTSR